MLSVRQKSLVLVLILAMILPMVPVFSIAKGTIDDPDVAPKYDIDTFYMNAVSGSSLSSGAIDRWTSIQNVSMSTVEDPKDPSNKVSSCKISAGKTGIMRKNLFHASMPKFGETYVWNIDFMLPEKDATTQNQTLTLKMFGNVALSLEYNATTDKFEGSFYGESISVAPGQWVRFYNEVTISEGKNTAAIKSQLSTAMTPTDNAGFYVQKESSVTISSDTFELHLSSVSGYEALAYIDNIIIATLGDFGEATVTTESYNDYYRNFKLQGQIKVKLYHTMDLSTFDFADIRLANSLSEDIPYTSVILSHDAQTLIFDFSEHKLPKFEDIYICFGDKVRDTQGNDMYEPTVILATLGDEDEIPPPQDVLEVPANGFVMPDQWNTGYRCDFEDLVPLSEKYPEIVANGNVISEKIARQYNYEFSFFTHDARLYVVASSPVYIHDFYVENSGFSNGKSGAITTSSSRLTIAWGEGNGSYGDFFGGGNMTISHCYIHDVVADHMKAASGQIVEFNYFRDGGTRNPGAHADVVQFMGDWTENKKAGMHILFYGNRFDAPNMAYDHVANCCFFYKPEKGSAGYVDVQSVGNWFNGGGYTTYLTPANDKSLNQQLYYNDNKWGYGYTFGPINGGDGWQVNFGGSHENNGYVTNLQTGSVVYYSLIGGAEDRVYSAEEMVGSEGRVMVNFANYMTMARGYEIQVDVLDREGNVVTSATKTGIVRRYTPVKEYNVSENLRDTGLKNPENGGTIYELIEKPDLPHDVPEYVELTNLPQDMENHTISVKVYDTTNGKKLIRTSNLGLEIYDDTNPARIEPEDTYYTVTFQVGSNNILSMQSVKAGESAKAPQAPTVEGKVFVGWSLDFSNVQSNMTVEAIYETVKEPVFFTVIFKDEFGNILSEQSVLQGNSADAPNPPEKEGHSFVAWSADFSNVQSNLVVTPLYEAIDYRSQELKAFEQVVIAVENAANSSFAIRLQKLQAAYASWLKVDKSEAGAIDVYVRLEEAVLAYNQDIASYNETMQQAEKTSQTTVKVAPILVP